MEKLELKSFFELLLYKFVVELLGVEFCGEETVDCCSSVNESIFLAFDANDSRFGFEMGELCCSRDEGVFDDIGMDELRLLNDESFRRL